MRELINSFFSLFRRVVKTDIVKVFSFTAVSTLVKMLTGLVSVKIVAAVIGPAGVALVGQLHNFATIAMSVSSGGINNGITKYIAEYKDTPEVVHSYLSTAIRITAVCSVIVGILMITFHSFLSKFIMLSLDYGYVFVIFGFTILLYALNMMLISIINGFKEFKSYVRINIANSIVGLVFTLTFVFFWGLKGALASAVTYQSIMLFVTLWMIRHLSWFNLKTFKKKYDSVIASNYFRYTLMTLTTAATLPVSQMILRGYVIAQISPIEAGWWEAMNRISNMYLMIITSSFGVYYLPRLSELTDKVALRHEICRAYKLIIPMLLVGFSCIYLIRGFVIRFLYTPDFLPMENLFIWQLIGDLFKIASWLLSFLMVAKSMTKAFISTEIFFALNFIGLGFLFIGWNGVVGITQASLCNNVIYFVCMIFLMRIKKYL